LTINSSNISKISFSKSGVKPPSSFIGKNPLAGRLFFSLPK